MPSSYSVTTSSDVNKIWRKVQGKLMQALRFEFEESAMVDDMSALDVDFSLREVTVPIDINEGYGVAAIAEGGYEALPSTPNVEEITLPISELSKRFTVTTRSANLQDKPGAVIQKNIVYAGRKAMQAMGRDLSDRFYGFATGVLAQTTTVATQASGAYTLANLYGVSGLGSAGQLAAKFKVGSRVALVRAGALVTNAVYGQVTAINAATPSITVTWPGSVTSASGDNIVLSNSIEAATLAGTDYNKSIVGLLDAMTSTSVHGLSSSSVPDWSVAYSDTSSAAFSGIKWIRAKQEIANKGGDVKKVMSLFSQGVYRNLVSTASGSIRYSDPVSMEIVGDIKVQGDRVKSTQRVPAGAVLLYDRDAYRRVKLPMDEAKSLTDAIRMQDQAAYIFPFLHLHSHAVVNRKRMAYFLNQTES